MFERACSGTKYGAFFTFNNVTTPRRLLVGPGAHCAWFTVEKNNGFDIAVEERRFFDHHLKGVENGVNHEPPVHYYTYNESAGNEWRRRRGSLTAPLEKDVRVTGHPVAELWVSSTATDGDFIATLQDVAPDGSATSYNMSGRLRASLRKEQDPPYDNLGLPWHPFGSGDVQPLVAGEPTRLRFDLLPISIRFKAGHRIRLVITFAEANTPRVTPAPTVTVYRDGTHPSLVTLPVIEAP